MKTRITKMRKIMKKNENQSLAQKSRLSLFTRVKKDKTKYSRKSKHKTEY